MIVIVAVYKFTGDQAGILTYIPSGAYVKLHVLIPTLLIIVLLASRLPPTPKLKPLHCQLVVTI